MKFTTNQIGATIVKLTRQTKEGKLKWSFDDDEPSSLGGTEELVDYVYYTEVSDINFRLYKYQYRNYTDIDEYFMSQTYRLEMVDNAGKSLWEFPRDEDISDLYESVRFKTSGAADFFTTFLNE